MGDCHDTLLEGLAPDLQGMAAARRPFVQEENPMVRRRDLPRQRHLAPADHPHLRDRVVGRAEWARRDERYAVTGTA
jgi:hypothetical protein